MEEHSKELNKGSMNHSNPGHSINASTPSTQPRKKIEISIETRITS
jgi:hypothetical protein